MIYQGTRPAPVFLVDTDLTGMTVYLYIKTATGEYIVKSGNDLMITVLEDGTSAIITILEQEETLQLPEGTCQARVRWIDEYGNPGISDPGYFQVVGTEPKDVIAYRG